MPAVQDTLTSSSKADQLAALQEHQAKAAKERAALKTILEAKMRPLLASISENLSAEPGAELQGPSVHRQLTALDRLLRATIAAM